MVEAGRYYPETIRILHEGFIEGLIMLNGSLHT